MRIKEIYLNAANTFSAPEVKDKLMTSQAGLLFLITEYKERKIDTNRLIKHIADTLVITHLAYVKTKGLYEDFLILNRVDNITELDIDMTTELLNEMRHQALFMITHTFYDRLDVMLSILKNMQSKMMLVALLLMSEEKIRDYVNESLEKLQNDTINKK